MPWRRGWCRSCAGGRCACSASTTRSRAGAFYQKAAPSFGPGLGPTGVTVPKKGGTVTHAVCDDAATLVYLANQNCITPHVWLSREPHLDQPDRLIVDLDPGPAGLDGARSAAARHAEALLEAGLAPYLMATGSNGFHVVTPIEPAETFDPVAEIAWQFAAVLAGRVTGPLDDRVLQGEARRPRLPRHGT